MPAYFLKHHLLFIYLDPAEPKKSSITNLGTSIEDKNVPMHSYFNGIKLKEEKLKEESIEQKEELKKQLIEQLTPRIEQKITPRIKKQVQEELFEQLLERFDELRPFSKGQFRSYLTGEWDLD